MSIDAVQRRLSSFPESSVEWSLASDRQVCELLKKISNDIISEVTQVSHNVSEVQIETRQLGVVMQNVCNDLCMLANEQFIENLVEDVQGSGNETTPIEIVQASKEEKTVQTIPLITQALRMGLQVLENQFEIIDIARLGSISQNFSENDQDTQTIQSMGDFINEPIFQPKDPYEHRHLPHFIGSSEFIEDDTLGIGYIDDIEEVQEKSPESRSVASVSSNRRDYLTSSSSDSEEDLPSKISKVVFDDEVSQLSDYLFESKSITKVQVDSSLRSKIESSNKPLSLNDQLNKQLKARLSMSVKPSDNVSEDMEETFHTSDDHISKTKEPSSNMWSDDEDIFTTLNKKGLAQKKAPTKTAISANIKEEVSKVVKVPSQTQVKTPVILEDITDSEDDMFEPSKTVTTNKKKEVPVIIPRKISEVFSDTDDDMFKPPKTVLSTTKETPSVSRNVPPKNLPEEFPGTRDNTVKSSKSVIAAKRKEVPTVEDTSDSDDMFLTTKSQLNNKKKHVPQARTLNKKSERSEDDDDLFDFLGSGKLKSSKQETSPKVTKEPTNKSTKEETPSKVTHESTKKSQPIIKPFNFSSDEDDLDALFKVPSHKDQSLPIVTTIESDSPPKVLEIQKTITDVVNPKTSESSDSDSIFASSSLKTSTMKTESEKSKAKMETTPKMIKNDTSSLYDPLGDKIIPKAKEQNIATSTTSKDSVFSNTKQKSDFEVNEGSHKKDIAGAMLVDPLSHDPLIKGASANVITDAILTLPSTYPSKEQSVTSHEEVIVDSTINISSIASNKDFSHGLSAEEDMLQESDKNQTNNSSHVHLPGEVEEVLHPQTIVQRTSLGKPLAGARLPFGGMFQNISLMDELNERNRKNKTPDNIEGGHKDPTYRIVDEAPVVSPRSMWPTMNVTREESPGVQYEVSLDAPAKIVNQLTNLTKTRARRPATKKEVIPGEKVSVAKVVVPEVSKVTVSEESKVAVSEVTQISVSKPLVKESPLTMVDDDTDIFANLPLPEKKTKSKNKESTKTKVTVKPKEVDVNEIDDIFGIPSTKTASKKKSKTKKASVRVDDPLGAM